MKLGAPPSYILRRGEVIELRAETLPIGIIKGLRPPGGSWNCLKGTG